MKNHYALLFFLLIGCALNSFAQLTFKSYETKTSELSARDKAAFDHRLNDLTTQLMVDENGVPKKYLHFENANAEKILLNNPSELSAIVSTYPNDLANVQTINLVWNGTDISTEWKKQVSQLKNLGLIYIRSYSNLDEEQLRKSFGDLLNYFSAGKQMELIFYKMEEAR